MEIRVDLPPPPLPNKVGDVALPPSWSVAKEATADADAAKFVGAWAGRWGDELLHVLIVETVSRDGAATVVYAVGDAPHWGISRQWSRDKAQLRGGRLVLSGSRATISYQREGSDRLAGTYRAADGCTTAGLLQRIDPAVLKTPDAVLPEVYPGEAVRIPHVVRDRAGREQSISLAATFYRARGAARAPLVISSHGSTDGISPRRTFRDLLEARYFLGRGFAVVVPMRRGRGESGGRYGEDDGFVPPPLSAGEAKTIDWQPRFAQAVEDLDAVMRWAGQRDDFDPGRVLLTGQSRGGILSVVYAGMHPEQVRGVINFVGGWTSERVYPSINTDAFAAAGRTARAPQLWFYADNDRYYREQHIRLNHAAFTASGGTARLELFRAVGREGHFLGAYPELWQPIADEYLRSVMPAQR